ncbi:MAG: hypothetical protein J6L88_02265 [Clostridia bacterium]|nr:hypothetical protein [Clostridia bacterium]
MDTLKQARQLLEHVTPMKSDCGALCSGICCSEAEGDGMVLLPGEEKFYEGADWCEILQRGQDKILVCRGTCPRENRPFACRIFPICVNVTEDKTTVGIEPLAKSICPLCDHGLKGLDREFRDAAKQAFRILLADETYRAHYKRLTDERIAAFDDPLFKGLI